MGVTGPGSPRPLRPVRKDVQHPLQAAQPRLPICSQGPGHRRRSHRDGCWLPGAKLATETSGTHASWSRPPQPSPLLAPYKQKTVMLPTPFHHENPVPPRSTPQPPPGGTHCCMYSPDLRRIASAESSRLCLQAGARNGVCHGVGWLGVSRQGLHITPDKDTGSHVAHEHWLGSTNTASAGHWTSGWHCFALWIGTDVGPISKQAHQGSPAGTS